MRKRGITDFGQLFCAPRTAGNFGHEAERTRRIVKVDCFDMRGARTDVFAKPIEGLIATVDLDRHEVLDVTDLGVVPIPGGNSELDPASTGPQRSAKPIVQTATEGSNFTLDGSMVRWQNWSFHVRWDIREGVVVSLVRYRDGDRQRSMLYQGHLAEIFVPYQDPTEGWYYRNYMDQGEYGFGSMASALVPGADCPAPAVYLSPVMSNAAGGADVLDNRICLFERSPGEPAWRHYDFITQSLESRPAIELVVRFISTVGNYDYLFDWVFDQKGNITYRAGATGIDTCQGRRRPEAGRPDRGAGYGVWALDRAGTLGINHDHFLSVRLDLDVDGTSNMFASNLARARRIAAAGAPTHRHLDDEEEVVATTDTEAKFRLDYEHPSMWHVMNMNRKSATGYPVGYMIHPHGNALDAHGPGRPGSKPRAVHPTITCG